MDPQDGIGPDPTAPQDQPPTDGSPSGPGSPDPIPMPMPLPVPTPSAVEPAPDSPNPAPPPDRPPDSLQGSALNALKHGLLAHSPVLPSHETVSEWEEYQAAVCASLQPVGPAECLLVGRAALLLWRLRRIARFESENVAQKLDLLLAQGASRETFQFPDSSPGNAPASPAQLDRRLSLLKDLWGLPEGQPVDSVAAAQCLEVLGRLSQVRCLPYNWRFPPLAEVDGYFSGFSVPWDLDVWTAGLLRDCFDAVQQGTGFRVRDVLVPAVRGLTKRALEEAEVLLAEKQREVEKGIRCCLLPDDHDLELVMRYEAHLNRQLASALAQLQTLRQPRPSPCALTLDGSPQEPDGEAAPNRPASVALPAEPSRRWQAALPFLKRHGCLTRVEYRRLTGISHSQALRDLADLTDAGLLCRRGSGNGTHYVLPEERQE